MRLNKPNRISCAIAVLLLLLASLPLAAATEQKEVVPIIQLTGGQAYLTNVETGENYLTFMDMGNIGDLLAEFVAGLPAAIAQGDRKALARPIADFMWEAFGELQMFPDGSSKNPLFRTAYGEPCYVYDLSGTRVLFDPTAPENIAPVRPAEPPLPAEPATQPTTGAVTKLSAQAEEPPVLDEPSGPSWDYMAVLRSLGGTISSAFFGAYDAVQDYIDANGLRGKQPAPDPAWDNIPQSVPAGVPRHTFAFDWRLSPIDNAKILNNFIQAVKERYGCSKVVLQPTSASNGTVLAYLDEYVYRNDGEIDVAGVLFNLSLANGSSAYGTLFQKDIKLDARAVASSRVLTPITDNLDPKIHAVLKTLYVTGLLDVVLSLTELLPPEIVDVIMDEAMIPLYGMFPSMWSLIPEDMVEDAKKISLGDKLHDPTYKPLLDKIDAYTAMQKNSDVILRESAKKTKVGVIAGYGQIAASITNRQHLHGDTGLETTLASFGATCAPFGEELGRNYRQQNTACGHNHISPDNIIDASSCALPEHTWFIKGVIHGADYEYTGFTNWWYYEENPTVHTNSRWPQYLYDYSTETAGAPYRIYPLQKPIYEGGTHLAQFSVFWYRLLTVWSKVVYAVVGTLTDAARGTIC